jgi:hypothetical protein
MHRLLDKIEFVVNIVKSRNWCDTDLYILHVHFTELLL